MLILATMAQALFMNSEVYDVELTSQLLNQKERDLLKSTSNLIDFDSKVDRYTDIQIQYREMQR